MITPNCRSFHISRSLRRYTALQPFPKAQPVSPTCWLRDPLRDGLYSIITIRCVHRLGIVSESLDYITTSDSLRVKKIQFNNRDPCCLIFPLLIPCCVEALELGKGAPVWSGVVSGPARGSKRLHMEGSPPNCIVLVDGRHIGHLGGHPSLRPRSHGLRHAKATNSCLPRPCLFYCRSWSTNLGGWSSRLSRVTLLRRALERRLSRSF